MSFFTYILECSDKTYYVGCTNNIERRIRQHNQSKWGAHYTKLRRPVNVRFVEKFETLIAARRREKELKGWKREKKERLLKKTG